MSDLRHRPTFKKHLASDASCLLTRLKDSEREGGDTVRASVIDSTAILKIRMADERVWSPQLEVSFEADPDGSGCFVHGLFGPRPSVWTSFMAGYLFFLCVAFVSFLFGMTSYWLGMDARTLYIVPAAIAGMAGVFAVARAGRKLGADQMSELFDFLTVVIGDCESGHTTSSDNSVVTQERTD